MPDQLQQICKRCGKTYTAFSCPYCTVMGLDIQSLLSSEPIQSIKPSSIPDSKVILVDEISHKTFPIREPICKIGRDVENDICLSGDKSLSRFHFSITLQDEEFYLEDNGSRNGTYINGSPLTAIKQLRHGDIISAGMGRYLFAIKERWEKNQQETLQSESGRNTPTTLLSTDNNQTIQTTAIPSSATSETTPQTPWPSWCKTYALPELSHITEQINQLQDMIRQFEQNIQDMHKTMQDAELIRNQLLAGSGADLYSTIRLVFEDMGWEITAKSNALQEMSLTTASGQKCVVRISTARTEPNRQEVTELIGQQATVWCDTGVEPKGILIAQILTNGLLQEKARFSADLIKACKQKRFCLLSTLDILYIFRKVTLAAEDPEPISQAILQAAGIPKGLGSS